MLRLVFAVSLLALSGASGAHAEAAWVGRAVITAAPGNACSNHGHTVGQVFDTAFLPAGVANNGGETYLTFYGNTTAFSVHVHGLPAANKAYGAVRINPDGKYNDALIGKVKAFSAPAFTATTQFLDFTIQLNNWEATVGCVATLAISSTLHQ